MAEANGLAITSRLAGPESVGDLVGVVDEKCGLAQVHGDEAWVHVR